ELFEVYAIRLLAVGEPVLRDFESLLKSCPTEEPRFQDFLTNHPQLLDPMAVQVWPQPSLWGAREPDFVVRRSDDTYLVIEIECPSKLLLTSAGQLSADTSHAVNQVLDYADRLTQRQELIVGVFPRFRAPDCLVVNGLEGPLTPEQKRMLVLENAHRRGVRIVGFDWLVSRARAIMTGYVNHDVTVSKARLE
ncbi:MAG: Shedu anti-phage system protein SduA domain-containing protein, partial [Myxococcales bacterium]